MKGDHSALFNRFAHSAGPGVEGSVWQASSLRTPGQANGESSYPMRVTRVARPARCFDGGFKTRSPGAAKISLPGLQNGLLEVSAEIVAGRLCGPPRGGKRVSGRTFWGTFATHARSMRNDKHGSRNQHVGSALNRFRIDPGSLQIDRGTRIEPGIGHAVGPLARRICGFVMVSCREAASERPASSPAGKYLWGDRTSVHASAHLSR